MYSNGHLTQNLTSVDVVLLLVKSFRPSDVMSDILISLIVIMLSIKE